MKPGFRDSGFAPPYSRKPFSRTLHDVTTGPLAWRLARPVTRVAGADASIPCSPEAVAKAGALSLSRDYADRRMRLESARRELQSRQGARPITSDLPPFDWLPAAIEAAGAEVAAAEAELAKLLQLVSRWIEAQLRDGCLILSGRPDPTAPQRVVARDECAGLHFEDPEPHAVRLADGTVLFDARLCWPPTSPDDATTKPAQAKQPLKEISEKTMRDWASTLLAQGGRPSKKAAEEHFKGTYSRGSVRKVCEVMPWGQERPGRPISNKSPR